MRPNVGSVEFGLHVEVCPSRLERAARWRVSPDRDYEPVRTGIGADAAMTGTSPSRSTIHRHLRDTLPLDDVRVCYHTDLLTVLVPQAEAGHAH